MPRTPGLIRHNPRLSSQCHERVYSTADELLVADVGSHLRDPETDKANAAHVVECWNACEGMTNPVKTIPQTRKALSEAIEFLETYPHQNTVDFSDHLEALRKSLDALGKA